MLFTIHVYQYRIEKANQAGLPGGKVFCFALGSFLLTWSRGFIWTFVIEWQLTVFYENRRKFANGTTLLKIPNDIVVNNRSPYAFNIEHNQYHTVIYKQPPNFACLPWCLKFYRLSPFHQKNYMFLIFIAHGNISAACDIRWLPEPLVEIVTDYIKYLWVKESFYILMSDFTALLFIDRSKCLNIEVFK